MKFDATRPSMVMGHFMADVDDGSATAAPNKAAASAARVILALIISCELKSFLVSYFFFELKRNLTSFEGEHLVMFQVLFICGREENFPTHRWDEISLDTTNGKRRIST